MLIQMLGRETEKKIVNTRLLILLARLTVNFWFCSYVLQSVLSF